MSDMLEAALELAGIGLAVFPLKPKSKQPQISRWQDDATTNPDTIRGWWGQWPSANIAIATGPKSGIVVVDVDGPEGEVSLADLEGKLGALPLGAVVRTGRGRHIYLAASGGKQIRNSAGKLGDKIDVRGEGGYVVAPLRSTRMVMFISGW